MLADRRELLLRSRAACAVPERNPEKPTVPSWKLVAANSSSPRSGRAEPSAAEAVDDEGQRGEARDQGAVEVEERGDVRPRRALVDLASARSSARLLSSSRAPEP